MPTQVQRGVAASQGAAPRHGRSPRCPRRRLRAAAVPQQPVRRARSPRTLATSWTARSPAARSWRSSTTAASSGAVTWTASWRPRRSRGPWRVPPRGARRCRRQPRTGPRPCPTCSARSRGCGSRRTRRRARRGGGVHVHRQHGARQGGSRGSGEEVGARCECDSVTGWPHA